MAREHEWTLEQHQKRLDRFPGVIKQHQRLVDRIGSGKVRVNNPDYPEWPEKIAGAKERVSQTIPALEQRFEDLKTQYPQAFQKEVERKQREIENREIHLATFKDLIDQGKLTSEGYNLHESRLTKVKGELESLKETRRANTSLALDEAQRTITISEWNIPVKTVQVNEFVWPALEKFVYHSEEKLPSSQVTVILKSGDQLVEIPSDEIVKRLREDLERDPNDPRIVVTHHMGRTTLYSLQAQINSPELIAAQPEEPTPIEIPHYDPVLEAKHLALEIYMDEPDINVAELASVLNISGEMISSINQLRSTLSKIAGEVKSKVEKGIASEAEMLTWTKISSQSSETENGKILKSFREKIREWADKRKNVDINTEAFYLRNSRMKNGQEDHLQDESELKNARNLIESYVKRIDETKRMYFNIPAMRRLLKIPPHLAYYYIEKRHVSYSYAMGGYTHHPALSREEVAKLMYLANSNINYNTKDLKKIDDLVKEAFESLEKEKEAKSDNPS